MTLPDVSDSDNPLVMLLNSLGVLIGADDPESLTNFVTNQYDRGFREGYFDK
jgi:hypothetical protein